MKGCQLVIGRLVSHPCGARASAGCAQCGRAMCARHLAGPRCVECSGAHTVPRAPIVVSEEELMVFDEAELMAFDQAGASASPFAADS